jgi:hypothetical protein
MSEPTQPPQEQKPEEPTLGLPNVLEQLKGAGPKPTPSEIALLLAQIQAWDSERYRRWKDEQDEKWRRWREEQEEKKKQMSNPEYIEKLEKRLEELALKIESIGKEKEKSEPEKPLWALDLEKQVQAIYQRFEEEKQKERDRKLIEEHQKPLLEKLKEAEARYAQLEKTLEELKKMPLTPQQSTSLNETLKQIKETLSDIRETGKLLGLKEPEETQKSSTTFEGIPVKGEIPAAAIYIPAAIEKVLEAIEKRAEKLGLLDLLTPRKKTETVEGPLIRLPPPPAPQPKPTVETVAPPLLQPPTPIVEPAPIEPPQALPTEPPKVEVTISPPSKTEAKPKTYKCPKCGAEFDKPYKLAAHIKKHKREEKRQSSQNQPSNMPTK